MSTQVKKAYLRPEDVKPATARKVLAFLNATRSAEEIVDAIDHQGDRQVGIRVGQKVLDMRAELGGFEDLRQVAAVRQVGPQRFSDIITALGTRNEEEEISYIIEGQIKATAGINSGKDKLLAYVLVDGVELARANVDGQGKYKLAFACKDEPAPTMQLMICREELGHN